MADLVVELRNGWVCGLWVEAVVVCCEGGEAEVED
jgi:hypothetical protein